MTTGSRLRTSTATLGCLGVLLLAVVCSLGAGLHRAADGRATAWPLEQPAGWDTAAAVLVAAPGSAPALWLSHAAPSLPALHRDTARPLLGPGPTDSGAGWIGLLLTLVGLSLSLGGRRLCLPGGASRRHGTRAPPPACTPLTP